ncbi:hypothetical protein [Actinomadura kijaniata]|uniref:hypothetical protein n=1 Tax=Actinomadura kijaniata TaxID=46161 RepID=UPI00082BCFB6|nr:hypothetical protein [Actinomadura kijaniata]
MTSAPTWFEAQQRSPDAVTLLARLRAEFPHVGFVVDAAAGVWLAVRGKGLFVRASSGHELHERLHAVTLTPHREVTPW